MPIFELLSLVVCVAALFGWISVRWLRLPLTIGTMLLTVVSALGVVAASRWAPGLHPWALRLVNQIDFDRLILHGMLALLLFAGAFLLDLDMLWRERLAVAVLAVPGTVASALLIAALMHLVLPFLGLKTGWLPCLFFGALISPTDPIAVLEILRRVGASKTLQAQLAGESLFNDGVGAVIFLTVLDVARGGSASAGHITKTLLVEVGGGLLLGIAAAWVTSWMMRIVNAYQVEILMTLSLALGAYALADRLHFSAPVEAVSAGIALRRFNRDHPAHTIAHESIDHFWEVIDEIQNAVLFVLMGLQVLAIAFSLRTGLSGLAAIVIVNIVRLSVVAVALGSLRICRYRRESSITALTWGGLHGGLSLALAFAVPDTPQNAWILPATYI